LRHWNEAGCVAGSLRFAWLLCLRNLNISVTSCESCCEYLQSQIRRFQASSPGRCTYSTTGARGTEKIENRSSRAVFTTAAMQHIKYTVDLELGELMKGTGLQIDRDRVNTGLEQGLVYGIATVKRNFAFRRIATH
jgi:hypothetical protein